MKTRLLIATLIGVLLATPFGACAVITPNGEAVHLPFEAPAVYAADGPADPTAPNSGEPVRFPLAAMSDGEPLRARDIYRQVAPAIAHVKTPAAGGSAVLVQPGYLVTNAHVVWPYNSARIVFPDGAVFEEAPVIAWDLVADVAVLEMPETEIVPVSFVDGSSIAVGSDVYLIGYPGEVDEFPQPALTQGLLSRVRKWETIGLTLFQADADIAGGNSGGVLVTERGEVIGISTFYFTDARYAMVTSAADLVPRLEALLNEGDVAFNDRHPLQQEGALEHTRDLEPAPDTDLYFLEAEPDSKVELRVEGVGHPWIAARSVTGYDSASSEATADKVETLKFTAQKPGLYVVQVQNDSIYRNTYTLTGSHPLIHYEDPDGGALTVGETRLANTDVPSEIDVYEIDLHKGDRIAVEVDSLRSDPYITLGYSSSSLSQFVYSDDTGSVGVFGRNERLVYAAPADDTYTFAVRQSGPNIGGYFITLSEAGADEKLTELEDDQEFYATSEGRYVLYESELFDFSILYPAGWEEAQVPNMTASFEGENGTLMMMEQSTQDALPQYRSATGMMKLLLPGMLQNLPEAEVVSQGPFTTYQGLTGEMAIISFMDGMGRMSMFVYADELDKTMFVGVVVEQGERLESRSVAEHVLATFHVDGAMSAEADAANHLQRGMYWSAQEQPDAALAELEKALALDPALKEAYLVRAYVYEDMGDYDAALVDMGRAIELDPDNAAHYDSRGLLHHHARMFAEAVADSDRAIALDPDVPGFHNNRALYLAGLGDHEAALEAMATYAELVDDEIPPHALDTRAYIYLNMGDCAGALVDYEAALDKDFQRSYVLLGAGICYARNGDMAEAVPLLEYGMEQFQEEEHDIVDPELANLTAWAQEILAATQPVEERAAAAP